MSVRTSASHPIETMAFGAAVILALAACAPSLPSGTRACVGLPAEVCQNQVADLEQEGQGHGGLTAYRLACSTGSCTSRGGEGRLTVVFGDGTGREGNFGYATPAGNPPDAPSATEPPLTVTPVCLDVPEPWCERSAQAAASEAVASEGVRGGETVVSVTVRCTTTCTGTTGDAEMRVTLSDGTVVTSSFGYQSSALE